MPIAYHDSTRVSEVSLSNVFLSGVCGGAVMTFLLFLARQAGIPGMSLEMTYGTFFIHEPNSTAWWLGLAFHLIISGVIALLYVVGFSKVHKTGWKIGALFGIVHWFIGGFIMAAMPMIHPLQIERMFAPGFFAINSGWAGVLTVLSIHLAYGAVIGELHKTAVSAFLQPVRPQIS